MESSGRPPSVQSPQLSKLPSRQRVILAVLIASLPALLFYWLTVYPGITWWDAAEYAAAAICLGNPHPPGSLLLTLVGWVFTKLPLGIPDILSLNLLAGLIAASTGATIAIIALKTFQITGITAGAGKARHPIAAAAVGAAIGSMVFSLGETLWLYAIKFTPYGLTALFTALIILAAVSWWRTANRPEAFRWLLLLGLLIGLDFSVHRTNAVLLPGLLIWILMRRPGTLASIRSWLTGGAGLLLGLSLHLMIMPIARARPFLNGGYPAAWSRFWDYVSLKQMGGGFLMKFFPRNGDFWSDQVTDFVEAFATNFFTFDGLWFVGWFPLLLGITGLVFMWRRDRLLAAALAFMLIVTALVTIVYFNIPADFFRSLHRHYLPCLVIFGILVAYGGASITVAACNTAARLRPVALGLVALLLTAMPISQIVRNYDRIDGTGKYFAEDFARNMYGSLKPGAILLVTGDNDTFPLWYLKVAENIRPDVTILNLSLLNTAWYVKDLLERDTALPLSLSDEEIAGLAPKIWKETTIAVAAPEDTERFALPEDTEIPDSLYLTVGPSQDNFMMVSDQLVLQMFLENNWRRPFYLASTAHPSHVPWLRPYLRFEGLATQAVPMESPPLNLKILSRNLETYAYRGWDDPGVPTEDLTRQMVGSLAYGYIQMAQTQLSAGDTTAAAVTVESFERNLPLERLQPPEQIRQVVRQLKAATGR